MTAVLPTEYDRQPSTIKLIAADVDGTLLNSKKELTSEVIRAVNAVKERGIFFTIATGRDIRGLRFFHDLLSPGVPVITYNGAELRAADSGELISSLCLPEKSALEIIDGGLSRGFSVIVWSRGELYIAQPGKYSCGYADMYGIREKPLKDPAELSKNGITKVIWAGEANVIRELENELNKSPIPGSECCTSDVSYLEFMSKGVNKGYGLRAAAEKLGLQPWEVMAIGDGHNDLPMLHWAGVSVAMGNASPEVKSASRFVTESCDRNGLALALEKLVLNRGSSMQFGNAGMH
jgi:Cof subfamily protein (haloacid dehalogenase superfamily)